MLTHRELRVADKHFEERHDPPHRLAHAHLLRAGRQLAHVHNSLHENPAHAEALHALNEIDIFVDLEASDRLMLADVLHDFLCAGATKTAAYGQ